MKDRCWIRIEKDLLRYFENKKFGCQTKFFIPKSIITDSGCGWVDRTRGFDLCSTQPILIAKTGLGIGHEPLVQT